jgi:hypothetical protein
VLYVVYDTLLITTMIQWKLTKEKTFIFNNVLGNFLRAERHPVDSKSIEFVCSARSSEYTTSDSRLSVLWYILYIKQRCIPRGGIPDAASATSWNIQICVLTIILEIIAKMYMYLYYYLWQFLILIFSMKTSCMQL